MQMHILSCSVTIAALVSVSSAAQSLLRLSADSASLTAMTAYSNGAIVRHLFELRLPAGETTLTIAQLPETIEPNSVFLRTNTQSLFTKYLVVQPATISDTDVLRAYIGQTITLRQRGNIVEGVLLTPPSGVVGGADPCYSGAIIRLRSGELLVSPCGELLLPPLLPAFHQLPAIRATLVSKGNVRVPIELAYQCGGLQWNATYNAVILDDRFLQLSGYCHVQNSTQYSFRCHRLQLVAGSIRMESDGNSRLKVGQPMTLAARQELSDMLPTREQVDEYHLYTVPFEVTLAPNTTSTIPFRSEVSVPYTRRYVVTGRYFPQYPMREEGKVKLSVTPVIEFSNVVADSQPLPAGKVRLWHADNKGSLQFIGEDQIPHTPGGGKVSLSLGAAFDLGAERREVEFVGVTERVAEYTVEYTLTNAKSTPVQIGVIETFAGRWEITTSTLPYTKRSAQQAEFVATIPAKGATTFRYTVRHSW